MEPILAVAVHHGVELEENSYIRERRSCMKQIVFTDIDDIKVGHAHDCESK